MEITLFTDRTLGCDLVEQELGQEEGPPGEANPIEDVEVSEWVFEGLRSRRMCRRETATGLGLAICLHVLVPALVLLSGLLFAVPPVSKPPSVTVSLVTLAGVGVGSGGFPGAPGLPGPGAAGFEGKKASPIPLGPAVGAQRKARAKPRKKVSLTAKPVKRLSRRSPVIYSRRREKVFRDRPAPARAPASHTQPAPASGAVQGPKGNKVGGGSLPGGGSGGPGGGSGQGTGGSGGFGLKQVDIPPIPIKKVVPEFPDVARQMGISGKVVLKFLVEANGRVAKASVIAARPQGVFNQSALEAIGEWKFKPGRYRGKAVAVWVELPVRFDLSR